MNHESSFGRTFATHDWRVWFGGLAVAVGIALAIDQVGTGALGRAVVLLAVASVAGVLLFHHGLRQPRSLALLMVATLPIERIIAAQVGGTSVRIAELVGLVGLLVVGLRLATKQQRSQPFPIGWLLVAYLVVAGISAAWAVVNDRSLQVLSFTLVTMSLAWFVPQVVRTRSDLALLTRAVLIGATVALAYGAYQYLGDFVGLPSSLTGILPGYSKAVLSFPRLQSFMIEPLYFANYLFLPLGLATAFWIERVKGWTGGRGAAAVIGLAAAIGLTVSRGAYLALIPFTLTLLIVHYRQALTARVVGLGLFASVLVGGPAGLYLTTSHSPIAQKFVEHATLTDVRAGVGESSVGRLAAWNQALDAWRTAPLLGIGPGNFGFFVKGYQARANFNNLDIVNNEYLEVLAETGIVGLTLFVGVLLTLIVRQLAALHRATDPFLIAVLSGTLAAFAALLVQYNFFSTLYIVYVWVLIGIMVAAQNVAFGEANSKQPHFAGASRDKQTASGKESQ